MVCLRTQTGDSRFSVCGPVKCCMFVCGVKPLWKVTHSDYMKKNFHELLLLLLLLVQALCKMRPAERKARVVTLTNDNHVSGETIADFLYRGFLT